MSALTETGLASPIRSAQAPRYAGGSSSTRCAVAAARFDRIQSRLRTRSAKASFCVAMVPATSLTLNSDTIDLSCGDGAWKCG